MSRAWLIFSSSFWCCCSCNRCSRAFRQWQFPAWSWLLTRQVMITVTDSQGCDGRIFFFFSPLESSTYFLGSFFMRCDVFESHINSVPEFTRVDQRVGKNILLSEHPNLELPSGGEWFYQSNRTCGWCIKRVGEACFTRCDRYTRMGAKGPCSTSDHNFILQQNSEFTVKPATDRQAGTFPCIAPADIGAQLNTSSGIEPAPTGSLWSPYPTQAVGQAIP